MCILCTRYQENRDAKTETCPPQEASGLEGDGLVTSHLIQNDMFKAGSLHRSQEGKTALGIGKHSLIMMLNELAV